MKIRNDFVTNSCSSSFVFEIVINLKNGRSISYREYSGRVSENPLREPIDDFGKKIKENIHDIGMIKKITFKRKWSAWGEASSCFGSADYLEHEDEELLRLAEEVCKSDGDRKDDAGREMIEYLSHYKKTLEGGWTTAKFPTGFMGAKVDFSVLWEDYADSIEELAEMIASMQFYTDSDRGVETTVIDMQDHQIDHKAEYYLEKPL